MGFPISIMVLVVQILPVILWYLYFRLVSTEGAEPFEELNGPGAILKENTGVRTINIMLIFSEEWRGVQKTKVEQHDKHVQKYDSVTLTEARLLVREAS